MYETLTITSAISSKVPLAFVDCEIMRHKNLIPTLADARRFSIYKPSGRNIVEGGIVDVLPYNLNRLTKRERGEIIHAVGRGFAKKEDKGFFRL